MTSEEPRYEIQEDLMIWSPTWEEAQEIIEKAMKVDSFKLKADMAKIYKAVGEDLLSDNAEFLACYEGPICRKMYDKENRQAMVFVGYMGLNKISNTLMANVLFVLSYNTEEEAIPMIALAMPIV